MISLLHIHQNRMESQNDSIVLLEKGSDRWLYPWAISDCGLKLLAHTFMLKTDRNTIPSKLRHPMKHFWGSDPLSAIYNPLVDNILFTFQSKQGFQAVSWSLELKKEFSWATPIWFTTYAFFYLTLREWSYHKAYISRRLVVKAAQSGNSQFPCMSLVSILPLQWPASNIL